MCSLLRRKNLLSLPPKSSHIKWTGRTSPGQGAAGRCEVACLNALRAFSCAEKSDSAPLSPSFFSPNSLVFKGKKKKLSIETDSPWPGRGDFNPLRSAIKGN